MSNVGFRICGDFERPSRDLIEQFRDFPVANIADNMNRICCIGAGIRPYNSARLLGPAFTIKASAGDNLMFHKALDMARPGDVLVVAAGGHMERALCGEIMIRYAMQKQLGGFLIDGCIRDSEAAAQLDFPVYAKGVTPDGPYKNGPGEINVPVSFGGIVIFPGDILIGDADGVVAVRPQDAPGIIEKTKKVLAYETQVLEDITSGKGIDREWIDQLLKAKGCSMD